MASDEKNRVDFLPYDSQVRWHGANTDIRVRPTPNQMDEIRRKAKSLVAENAMIAGSRDSVSALAYEAGVAPVYARRIVELETENFLIRAVLDSLEERIAKLENKS
jgi:hypothetical protein